MEILSSLISTLLFIGAEHISNAVKKAELDAANGILNDRGYYNRIRSIINQLKTEDMDKYDELSAKFTAIPYGNFSSHVNQLYSKHRKEVKKKLTETSKQMRNKETSANQLENALLNYQANPSDTGKTHLDSLSKVVEAQLGDKGEAINKKFPHAKDVDVSKADKAKYLASQKLPTIFKTTNYSEVEKQV